MDLSILIVTYNSARLVGDLLSRLQIQLQELHAEVIVVDNASRDNTVDVVRSGACQGSCRLSHAALS